MNKTLERLFILVLVLFCGAIVWSQLSTWANAQTSIPGPGSATISVTTANGALESTQRTIHVDLGAPGDTVCATDSGTCSLAQLIKRTNVQLSSLIALLPTSLGAGGGLKVDGSGTALPVSAASLPLPSGAATSALQANGPNASCASYKSTTTTVSKTGASVDLSATGNTKWTSWRNNSRTYRITITDPASTTITLWPNDSVQFSVDAAATPDNTTATCPDCGSATTYFTGVGCDD